MLRLPLLLTLIGMSFSNIALADFDFSGAIPTQPIVSDVTGTQGYKAIRFQIKINNSGSSDFRGSLNLKPFVVVADGQMPKSTDQTGAVLDTMNTGPVSIASKSSITVYYNSVLPKLRKAPYALAVFINNDQSVLETNTLDNVTDLVKISSLEVIAAPVGTGTFNLSAKFDGDINLRSGGLSDLIRTIVHGISTDFPGVGGDSLSLWARFMLMDLKTNKVHTTPYINYGDSAHTTCLNQPNTDKQWFAISYNVEKDELGNPIYVDYYQQAPCFEDTAPGDYLFVELLNSRDLVKESDVHDDINMLPVSITPISTDETKNEIWMVHADSAPAVTQAFSFHANYMKRNNWNIYVDGNIPTLAIDATSGSIGGVDGTTYGQTLNLQWTPGRAETESTGNLKFGFSAFPESLTSIPIRLFNFVVGAAPVLIVPIPTTNVSLGMIPQKITGQIAFLNTGTAPMQWKADSAVTWITVSKTNGTTAPGATTILEFELDGGRISYGSVGSTSILLTNSSADTYHSLPIHLNWLQ